MTATNRVAQSGAHPQTPHRMGIYLCMVPVPHFPLYTTVSIVHGQRNASEAAERRTSTCLLSQYAMVSERPG